MANYYNYKQYAALRRKGKLKPFRVMTDAELQQSAQAMLDREKNGSPRLKPKKDNSVHNGQRWSLIDGKKIYHD